MWASRKRVTIYDFAKMIPRFRQDKDTRSKNVDGCTESKQTLHLQSVDMTGEHRLRGGIVFILESTTAPKSESRPSLLDLR